MKTKNIIISIIFLTFTFSSCRDINVSTIVNKDGSFTRIVEIIGDSADVFKSGLPYKIDESWNTDFRKDTLENDNYILTYSKSYKNSDILNEELKSDTRWVKDLKREINVTKRFGFFYTYLEYSESIEAANPFTRLDYNNYFTEEDLNWVFGKKVALTSQDSIICEKVDDKVEDFLEKAFAEEIITALQEGVQKLNHPSLPLSQIEEFRDSIISFAADFDLDPTILFVDYFAGLTNNPNALQLKEINPESYYEIDKKLKFLTELIFQEDYTVIVEMPGIITNTNSLEINGNSVRWKANSIANLFIDYEMEVESRVINKWMFILTGIILLSLVILIIIKSRK